jgi:hypothetical protein
VRDAWDDEQLLAALCESVRARRTVPDDFVETAENTYAWHDIDAELAELSYDSQRDDERSASMRSEIASIRALTFAAAGISIELEVAGHSVLGQISPAQEGTIEIQTRAGGITVVPYDEIGCFSVAPEPTSPFRLRCRTADGADVVTEWITL